MGEPKALLKYDGLTFLERIMRAVDACGISDTLVVVGEHQSQIHAEYPSLDIVFNPDYARGMTTSFQAGIRALRAGVGSGVFFLVDHPVVSPDTVAALIRHDGEADVIVPVYEGRRGHPVLFSREFMREVLDLSPDLGVNTLFRSQPGRVLEVNVQDRGILWDIDTPEDFDALRQISGREDDGGGLPGSGGVMP